MIALGSELSGSGTVDAVSEVSGTIPDAIAADNMTALDREVFYPRSRGFEEREFDREPYTTRSRIAAAEAVRSRDNAELASRSSNNVARSSNTVDESGQSRPLSKRMINNALIRDTHSGAPIECAPYPGD